MEINLEILIASLALILSLLSLYHQFFHKEIVVYPGVKNGNLYLHIENSGQSLVSDFSIQILDMDDLLSNIEMKPQDKKAFKERNGINGKASNTLASKGRRTILLGNHKMFRAINRVDSNPFPILIVKVDYGLLKKSKKFICDYNTFRNEMIDYDVTGELKELNNILRSKNNLRL